MKRIDHAAVLLSLIFGMASCSLFAPAPESEDVLAEPIEGLTQLELNNHLRGDAEFARIFQASDGLGPIFVSNSCESCHAGDGKGHPSNSFIRFGRYVDDVWDPMLDQGGPQLQHRSIAGYTAEQLPNGATGFTTLLAPAITGLGYLEAITDETLLGLADPNDINGDGISGRANWVDPPDFFIAKEHQISRSGQYIGRFGKKAAAIDLLHQTVNAYLQDMGITSDFSSEDLVNVQLAELTGDFVLDPEVSRDVVSSVVFYLRTLKVPPRRNQANPDVVTGETIFEQIGCAGCHTPSIRTGPSNIKVLANKEIHPYTDLLLHNMGPELNDGYAEGSAADSEWRTAPLWGLGLAADSQGCTAFYMHDGRATTYAEVIELHGGEAGASRSNFHALTAQEQEQLFAFLDSL